MTPQWNSVVLALALISADAAADPPTREPDWTRIVYPTTQRSRVDAFAGEPGGGAVFGGALYAPLTDPPTVNHPSAFLAKFDAQGAPRWSKAYGAGQILRATTDASGNIVLVALGTDLDVGCGPTPGGVLVAMLRNTGRCVWSRAIDVPATRANDFDFYVGALAADPTGGTLVTGLATEGVAFPDGTHVVGPSYITRLRPDGTTAWSLGVDTTEPAGVEMARGGGVDGEGIITIGMTFFDTMRVGGQTFSAPQTENAVVARFDGDGVLLDADQLKASSSRVDRVAVALDGSVAALGRFEGTIQIDWATLSSENREVGGFVARWAPAGWLAFARGLYGSADKLPIGLEIDGNGDVVFAIGAAPPFSGKPFPVDIPDTDLSIGSFFRVLHAGDGLFVLAKLAAASGAVVVLDPFDQKVAPIPSDAMTHSPAGIFLIGNAHGTEGDLAATRVRP